ncbi:MFS transporter [Petroclostridium sp. X23]|uniref:MFS transporter n=1 Tax=Petroclostridium sp. X23 TaxID=3045146 RepID=UPI0024ACFB86|nr:MFS transporter [Petroclostridium sp. X23]WHH59205.1 MFS transporter [Petroclostridium sp. X23]
MMYKTESHNIQYFFCMTFFFYGGYCIYTSYMVLYLTEQGYSAFFCGFVTSLTFLINIMIQPMASYLVDTFISIKYYMAFSIGMMVLLSLFAIWTVATPWLCIMIGAMAVFIMPFSYLLDAWIDSARELDPRLTYGTIRAGGSIGFGITSFVFGYCWVYFGHSIYFPVQAILFAFIFLFLWRLTNIIPKNRRKSSKVLANTKEDQALTFLESLNTLVKNRQYRIVVAFFLLYWTSHRLVGSYLVLIVQSRNGDAGLFGLIVGVGAVTEAIAMIILATRRNLISLERMLILTFLTACIRPFILLLTTNVVLMIVAQIMQSVSFALYYVSSIEALHKLADERIRAFSITIGLSLTNVCGTVIANLVGGWLCDIFGTGSVIMSSMIVTTINTALFYICARGAIADIG